MSSSKNAIQFFDVLKHICSWDNLRTKRVTASKIFFLGLNEVNSWLFSTLNLIYVTKKLEKNLSHTNFSY